MGHQSSRPESTPNWHNDCGVLARRRLTIKYDSWLEVPSDEKDALWKSLSAIYIFPPELSKLAKKATLKTMERCLQTFRSTLNRDYAQKDVTPFKRYWFIMHEYWQRFIDKVSSEEALKKSESFHSLTKRNKLLLFWDQTAIGLK